MKQKDVIATQEDSTNQDFCFTPEEILIIKSLLALAPSQTCKETKKLFNSIDENNIAHTYNKILSLSNATNKELIHYLVVMTKFPHDKIDLNLLVDLKFTAQDKYTSSAIYCYFKLVEHYYNKMNNNQRSKIFYRYIYLFNSQKTIDPSIYNIFQKKLDCVLLDTFINKRIFIGFPFIKDFIIDFAPEIPNSIIKIGYELPVFRNLIFHCVSNSKLQDNQALIWILKRWNVLTQKTIPQLFYKADTVAILDPIAQERFLCLDDPINNLKEDLKSLSKCDVCEMMKDSSKNISKITEISVKIKEAVDIFNKTGVLKEPLNTWILRLLPSIDLKSLGSFLCKQQNVNHLHKFVESFDFRNVDILEALRIFMSSFVMGGESQMIDRVISAFAHEYTKQNSKIDSQLISIRFDKCKKIAYGFIVLNTMLYNPSFDKKPTFEDYLSLLQYDEVLFNDTENELFSFNTDNLRLFYENIKENEMKVPNLWTDSYDKFQLFSANIDKIYETFSPIGSNNSIGELCDDCVLECYRNLFKSTFRSFMFLSPESFFKFSMKINCIEEFEEYLVFHRKNIPKFLEISKLYLENLPAQPDIINLIFTVLEKTEKQKNSVLPGIKTMLSKMNLSEIKDKPLSTHANYVNCVNNFVNMKFSYDAVAILNMKMLNELSINQKDYIKQIYDKIVVANSDFLDDLSILNEHLQLKLLSKTPEKSISLVTDDVKLRFLLLEIREEHDISKYYETFEKINVFNQDAFEVLCFFNQTHDQFSNIAAIIKENGQFKIEEKFGSILHEPSNILKFFTSSCTSLNIKIAKKIHKDGCPMNDPRFTNTDRIVYLIMKCNSKDKSLVEYASCIINYLSDSLILITNLYEDIFPVFSQISQEFSAILMKILLHRVKIFSENRISCCESTNDIHIESKIANLIRRMVDESLITTSDLKSLNKYISSKPDIIEL